MFPSTKTSTLIKGTLIAAIVLTGVVLLAQPWRKSAFIKQTPKVSEPANRTDNKASETKPAELKSYSAERPRSRNLFASTMREWRAASRSEKVDTCEKFLANAYSNNLLNLQLIDQASLSPYVAELLSFMDSALREADTDNNAGDYLNAQRVIEMLSLGTVMMGWSR